MVAVPGVPTTFAHSTCFAEFRGRLAIEAEAHRDDSGRKMQTSVSTFEPIDGIGTKYCMIEKIAGTLNFTFY